MKNLFIISVLSFLTACTLQGKESSFVKSYAVTSPANLKISTSGGNIDVTGYDKDVIEVTFIVRKRNQVLDITLDQLKEYAECDIVSDKQSLSIVIRKMKEQNVSVSFDIKTPYATVCKLNTSGGNITATDLTGGQEISTSGGNLHLEKITGKLDASTSGGNVTLKQIKGDTECHTSGGNMNLSNLEGHIHISTSGGNLSVRDVSISITGRTSGGNVSVSNTEGILDFNTSGGNIDLNNVAGNIKAITSGGSISATVKTLTDRLILRTSGGDVEAEIPAGLGCDLDLSADKVTTKLNNFNGVSEKGHVMGKINGGGIQVEMFTSRGTVKLGYK
jgi:hypothetical protein